MIQQTPGPEPTRLFNTDVMTALSLVDYTILVGYLAGITLLPVPFYLFVRFSHGMELISAYPYLKCRFSLPLRTICSLLFICVSMGWMATALYATSLALAAATVLPSWPCVPLIGGLTTVYSSLGGMRAVIWPDVAQLFVFIGAIIVVVATATSLQVFGRLRFGLISISKGNLSWKLEPSAQPV